jgi:hypothetical protein
MHGERRCRVGLVGLLLVLGTGAIAQESRNYGPIGGAVKQFQNQYREFCHDYVRKDKNGGVHVNSPSFRVDVSGPVGQRKVRVQSPYIHMDQMTNVVNPPKSPQPAAGHTSVERARLADGTRLAERTPETTMFVHQPTVIKVKQFIEDTRPMIDSSLTNAMPAPASPVRVSPVIFNPNPEGSVP